MNIVLKNRKVMALVGHMTFTLPLDSEYVTLFAEDMTPSELHKYLKNGTLIPTAVGYKMYRDTAYLLELCTCKSFPFITENVYNRVSS